MSFKLGLIGYPLVHSLSPKIHNALLKACGLSGNYFLFPVVPDDLQEMINLLNRIRSGKIHGLNITVPHKQNIIPFLDELTPTAQAIGAVNTVYMHNGTLTGDNTDSAGFLFDLHKFLLQYPQKYENSKSALVLGAGGSARAVVHALVNDGWTVTIAARRKEQALSLINQLLDHWPHLSNIEFNASAFASINSSLSLLVNSTSVGMFPSTDYSPWPAELPLPTYSAVYDLVYNPTETKLVRDARFAGLPATTGLGMLIEQASLSFEIWTGCKPLPIDLTATII